VVTPPTLSLPGTASSTGTTATGPGNGPAQRRTRRCHGRVGARAVRRRRGRAPV